MLSFEFNITVQLYSGSVLVAHIDGTFSQRSFDVQY